MFRFNQSLLKKVEEIFHEGGYTVRYEKGNFNNGYCILESKKVVVINKFHDTEAKINSLMDMLSEIDLNLDALSEEARSLYNKIISEKAETLFG